MSNADRSFVRLADELFLLPAGSRTLMAERVIDRALLALMHEMTPGWLTRGNVPKPKTGKQREIDRAGLNLLLHVLADDLRIETGTGKHPSQQDTEHQLRRLAVSRGLVTEPRTGDFRTTREYGPWTLHDVMSRERRLGRTS